MARLTICEQKCRPDQRAVVTPGGALGDTQNGTYGHPLGTSLRSALASRRFRGSMWTCGDLHDGLVFDAVPVRLIEIGEAIKAIPAELLASEPSLP
ncbi:MAG: hypothetical protein ACRDY0_09770 [Acidimicrobiales bacterium]